MLAEVQIVVCIDTEGPCADPGNPELLANWGAVDAAMDKADATMQRRGEPLRRPRTASGAAGARYPAASEGLQQAPVSSAG